MEPSFEEYARVYDILYKDKDYRGECDYLEGVFKRFAAKPVKRVLDVAAGTGSHVIELTRRGYACVGADIAPRMIQIAKQKASEARQQVPFHCAPMQKVDAGAGGFDAVICMFSAIDYLPTRVEVMSFLANAKRHLAKGGLLTFDFWNGVEAAGGYSPVRVREIRDGSTSIIRISRSELDKLRNAITVEFEMLVIEGDRVSSRYKERHPMRYFFPIEMTEMLADAGFELLHMGPFPDLSRSLRDGDWNVSVVARS